MIWKIETMAQVRRVYKIKTATEDEAEALLNEGASPVHEEDISEEIAEIAALRQEPKP